jgi:hypothetical protein
MTDLGTISFPLVQSETDVRIWAGSSLNDRYSAPFRVLQNGKVTASDIDIVGGSINITSNATIGNTLSLGTGSEYGTIVFKSNVSIFADSASLTGGFGLKLSAERISLLGTETYLNSTNTYIGNATFNGTVSGLTVTFA